MPKQKYYYAVVEIRTGKIKDHKGLDRPLIFTDPELADSFVGLLRAKTKVVPIPADSLHKLILSHTNKKAR